MAQQQQKQTVVVVVQLVTTSAAAREELMEVFQTIVQYSLQNEPEVLRYAVCGTQDGKDESTIYVIEEYASPAVHSAHMASPPVLRILSMLTTPDGGAANSDAPSLLAVPPKLFNMNWTPAVFEKPSLSSAQNPSPYIIWATIELQSAADVDTIAPYGAKVVEHAKNNEDGCLFYGDSREASDDKFIGAVEVYKDKAAFGVHAQGEALQAMIKECGALKGQLTVLPLKMKLGFLTRNGLSGS